MNTKIEIIDVLQKLYWEIDEIENPYDKTTIIKHISDLSKAYRR